MADETGYETLSVSIDDPVAHVQLSRPDKLNAMNKAFWREVPAAFDALDADTAVRAVVLSAQGRHFTAGLDLSMMSGMMPDPRADPARVREHMRRKILTMQETFTAIERCRKPVIAAVHGGCLGGGVDLVTACDLRYAASDAYFTIQEINIGMVADVGTLQRAPHLLPHGILRELAYTGRKFPAEEALRYGFVNGVLPTREAAVEAAFATAREIASKSPLAIAGIKHVLHHARDHGVAEGLDYVATWNAGMLIGTDVMEGAQAALARKSAAYGDLFD